MIYAGMVAGGGLTDPTPPWTNWCEGTQEVGTFHEFNAAFRPTVVT